MLAFERDASVKLYSSQAQLTTIHTHTAWHGTLVLSFRPKHLFEQTDDNTRVGLMPSHTYTQNSHSLQSLNAYFAAVKLKSIVLIAFIVSANVNMCTRVDVCAPHQCIHESKTHSDSTLSGSSHNWRINKDCEEWYCAMLRPLFLLRTILTNPCKAFAYSNVLHVVEKSIFIRILKFT